MKVGHAAFGAVFRGLAAEARIWCPTTTRRRKKRRKQTARLIIVIEILVSLRLGEFHFPIFSLSLSGVIRIGSPV